MVRASAVLFAAAALVAAAALAETTTSENGYQVTRSQALVPVPRGMVGRKTIDRETRVGVTEETDGNSSSFSMTLGGFMNRCPMPEGSAPVKFVVPGDFEFSVVVDSVDTDVVPTERTQHEKRMTARIKVYVNDDLSVTEGEIDGEFTSSIDGVRSGPVRLHKRFPIRAFGTPDFDALLEAVTVTGDMAAATLMWSASTTIMAAQAAWREPNACAELAFDPPSETRAVGPGETVEIRVRYRTRDGQQPIPKGIWDAAVEQGGRVTEASGQVSPDGTFVVRYVARSSGTPKEGDGARIEALSAAGYARDTWKILDQAKYEGSFTYVDALNDRTFTKVTGNLVWTPENSEPPSSPTFGETGSRFFRPSAGSFTIEEEFLNPGIGGPGTCEGKGSRTFPIEQMSRGALRAMQLEIADDGRYKLTLVIPDMPDPFPTWEITARCVFPNVTSTQQVEVKHVGVVLGRREGTLNAEQGVVGSLAAPIRSGPRQITGNWSFAKAQPNP